MLRGKIYLDKDNEGGNMLVFVHLVEEYDVGAVDYIAISPEAKALFLQMLSGSLRQPKLYFGDFEFQGDDGWEHGWFYFEGEASENGLKTRTLSEGEEFSVKVKNGYRKKILDYMIPSDNEFLKALDLTASVDENTLWQIYYNAMRERGEEPDCDTETIKKTPPDFLTDAQKEFIKRDYRSRCDEFDTYSLHNNEEAIDDLIVRELMKIYSKNGAVIEQIAGIAKT